MPDLPAPASDRTLVGREPELATLRDALAAALAGRGSLVLIGGEAGIGKTALAEALLAEAAGQGALVLVGRCYDLSETPPYGPWAEVFSRVPRAVGLPAPPDLAGDGATSQAALFAAVRDALAALAARQPLVLLLDDLHWADPASLDLLRVVAREVAPLPILALAAYRADELTRRHPLYALLPVLVREAQAARLALRRLGADDVRLLLRARYALPDRDEARLLAHLRAHAEGNPFYTGELLRALEEDAVLTHAAGPWALGELARVRVPPLLRQVLDARVDRLGEETRALLATAAVIGQAVPLGLWAVVAEVAEEALLTPVERAIEVRLLAEVPDGSTVRFAHALVREALYEGLLPVRRRRVHRRVGEALAAAGSPDPDAVAYHFRQAGDERAVAWLIRAGERAARAYAYLTAGDRYEAALRLLEERGGDAGQRGWVLHRLWRMRGRAAPRQALGYHDAGARLAAEAGDLLLAALVRSDRGALTCPLGDLGRGLAELAAGIAALEALGPADRTRLEALNRTGVVPALGAYRGNLAQWLAMAGRFAEAISLAGHVLADRAGPLPVGAADPSSDAAQAYLALALTDTAMGRTAAARLAYHQAKSANQAIHHHVNVGLLALFELSWVVLPYQADQPGERQRLAAEGEQAWARAGGVVGELSPQVARLPLLQLAGQWAEASVLAREGRAITALEPICVTLILGPLARWQGDAAGAWDLVHGAVPGGVAAAPGDLPLFPTLAAQRLAAALALDAGDLPTARAWLGAHDRWLAWSGAVPERAEGQLGWSAYYRATGDHTVAHAHAARALAHAGDPRQPLALLAAQRLLGELVTTTGRATEAQAHLDAALALATACAAPHERALTLLALAELRASAGHVAEAGRVLAEARAILEPLDARPALARAAALAQRLAAAAPPPAAAEGYPFGLTLREVAVVRLLAEGLTDQQIAARLFVSRNTVNAHLRAIYGKLGVNTRAAATRLALEQRLA